MELLSERSPPLRGGCRSTELSRIGVKVRRIRTAIIGTGFMGRVHLEALRRVEFVDVVAIAGRELAPAERLAAGFGVEIAVGDYRKLIEDATIDAIHICTPNATHYQMAKEALLADKHVLCEKPLSI